MPPRRFVLPRDCRAERIVEAAKQAKPNHRKAVDAWASWQRLEVSCEPLVTELLCVYP